MKKDFEVEFSFRIPNVVLEKEDLVSIETVTQAVLKRIGRPGRKLIERYNANIRVTPAERK